MKSSTHIYNVNKYDNKIHIQTKIIFLRSQRRMRQNDKVYISV